MPITMAGIAIESPTVSPLLTRLDDGILWWGSDPLAHYPLLAAYVDVTWVPLVLAHALPGGVVARPTSR
jgi:hypothetical protein